MAGRKFGIRSPVSELSFGGERGGGDSSCRLGVSLCLDPGSHQRCRCRRYRARPRWGHTPKISPFREKPSRSNPKTGLRVRLLTASTVVLWCHLLPMWDLSLDGFTVTNGTNSTWGAGIICYVSSPTISNCIITRNTSVPGGGGIYYCTYSSPTITNCTINGNARKHGGRDFTSTGTAQRLLRTASSPEMPQTLAGGIFSWDSTPTLTNCVITGNTATGDGGGFVSWSSTPTLINCTIAGNTATGNGGGIYLKQTTASVKNSVLWGKWRSRDLH